MTQFKFMDWKNVVKMHSLSKVIYRFRTIATKIPRTFYKETEIIPKIHLKSQGTLNQH